VKKSNFYCKEKRTQKTGLGCKSSQSTRLDVGDCLGLHVTKYLQPEPVARLNAYIYIFTHTLSAVALRRSEISLDINLQSQDGTILLDSTPEEFFDNISFENCLRHNPINVFRLNSPIPDAMSCQRVDTSLAGLHIRRQVNDDVSRKLMTTNMADQANTRGMRPTRCIAGELHSVRHFCHHRTRQDFHARRRESFLELGLQKWAKNSTSLIPTSVAAD